MRFRHILFLIALCTFSALSANKGFTIKTVVIDAGHGGKDPGAVGPGKHYEKDAALAVALKFGEYIEENFPDVKVIYTRKTDVFIELHQRAEIANKAKADLFVAIHCNSSPNSEFYGTSSYILGLHRSEANLEVAKRENAVILLEEDRDKNYEFNPNTPEGHIIMSMKQNAFLEQSIDFAAKIENQLENYAKRKSLGVKQAGFYVLYKTAMPSLLAEIGFISNPEEEKYLTSERGQDQIAAGLFNAFRDYKVAMEGGEIEAKASDNGKVDKIEVPVVKETPVASKPAPKEEPAPVIKKEAPVVVAATIKKEEPAPVVKKETPVEETPPPSREVTPLPAPVTVKETPVAITTKADNDEVILSDGNRIKKPVESAGGGGKTTASIDLTPHKSTPPPVEVKATKPAAAESTSAKPVVKEPVTTSTTTKTTVTEVKTASTVVKTEVKTPPAIKETKPAASTSTSTAVHSNRHPSVPILEAESGPVFRIQLFALKGELKEYGKFIRLFKVMGAEELSNGITRYYGGHTSSFAEATRFHELAISNGYKDAYIVGFKNGKRMNFDELKEFEDK